MRHLLMPSGVQQCLIYSAAMCLDVEPQEIVDYIRFTGEEIVQGSLDSPICAAHRELPRGIHIQEINEFALRMEHIFVPFNHAIATRNQGYIIPLRKISPVLDFLLLSNRALFMYPRHTVAWNPSTQLIHCPAGKLDTVLPCAESIWVMFKIKSSQGAVKILEEKA